MTKQPIRQHAYEIISTKDCEEMPQHFSYQATNCSQTRPQTWEAQLGSAILLTGFHLHLLSEHQLSPISSGRAPLILLWTGSEAKQICVHPREYHESQITGLAALEVINLNVNRYYFREAWRSCGWECGLWGLNSWASFSHSQSLIPHL